jgi:formiminoglutamase
MTMVFDHLVPAEDNVFYRRNDPNDVRFGEAVLRDPESYPDAQVVLVGCPQDEGVRRNKGRVGAQRAPTEIRKMLYRYPVSAEHEGVRLMDAGDILLGETLEETHDWLYETVLGFLCDGKKVIVLGGGNDISYPDCKAVCAVSKLPLVFNIDRHLDVRADAIRNSGTSYRQLLEEKAMQPSMFHEVGINSYANSTHYLKYVQERGAHVHFLGDVRDAGVGATVGSIVSASPADSIFFGFDLDVVHAAEAPGVSDPSPMGLTAREVCEIADVAARDPRTRVIEISEVNPEYDRDGITSKLAANIIVRALAKAK